KMTLIGVVVAVDEAAQTVTLRAPQRTLELKGGAPEQLALATRGSQVAATYIAATAGAGRPAARRKPSPREFELSLALADALGAAHEGLPSLGQLVVEPRIDEVAHARLGDELHVGLRGEAEAPARRHVEDELVRPRWHDRLVGIAAD